jgi:Ca2+-transporting ATPase
MTFTTLAFAQIFQAMASRSTRESFFSLGFRSNVAGSLLALLVFALQLVVVYVPFFQGLFNTQPLTGGQLSVSVLLSSLVFFAIEIEKWFLRHKENLVP